MSAETLGQAQQTPAFGRWDGHCHTAFSRRDGVDDTERFLARAVALGFERVSLTEHPTFPTGLIDETLRREVYLDDDGLERYLAVAEALRAAYADRLEVRVGFEIDYVPGRPDFPLVYLERFAGRVDDATLSLHFLPGRGGLRAVDVDPDDLEEGLVRHHGGIDGVRRLYWEILEEALERAHAWGLPFLRRLSHLDVVGKFRDRFPLADPTADRRRAGRVLDRVADFGWALDVNAKGCDVALRREAYPEADLLAAARERGIRLVYGSDAHHSAEVGRYRDALAARVARLEADAATTDASARQPRADA
jgi:histidinol-phosphatase (PHP family)